MVTQNHFVTPATVLEGFQISEGVTVTARDCTCFISDRAFSSNENYNDPLYWERYVVAAGSGESVC